MIPTEERIGLVPIKELKGMSFLIPDYQRGYRWNDEQVKDLLDDIQSFIEKEDRTLSEIYLLQPLVLAKREDESHVVVDGQQRLTTVYLLLRYLCKRFTTKYSIVYQTRDESWNFLDNIKSQTEDKAFENVDFYHMYKAYKFIESWFQGKDEKYKNKYKDVLLNNVDFIYYIIDNEMEIEVFTRLNIGKIPLTDSELVKAMILNKGNFSSDCNNDGEIIQHKIADEWNQIENTLQNDEFWLFIHSRTYNKPTRIDFLFELMIKKREEDINNEHSMFRYFEKVVNEKGIEYLWREIKKYFSIFKEWYNDYRLYHYIGYLVAVKNKNAEACIRDLLTIWDKKVNSKDEFEVELKRKIVETLKKDKESSDSTYKDEKKHNFLDELIKSKEIRKSKDYESVINKDDIAEYLFLTKFEKVYTKRCCVNILLLHDIESAIQYNDKLVNNNKYGLPVFERFPFYLYSLDNWDVEHIRPNSNDDLSKERDRLVYLLMAKEYYEVNEDIKKDILSYVNSDSVDHDKNYQLIDDYEDDIKNNMRNKAILFDKIKKDIITQYDAEPLGDEEKNMIWNYTLLDSSTNREYGNHIFPYKRAYIAEKERGHKLYFGITVNPFFDDKDPNSSKYLLVEARERKNEIVNLLLRFDKESSVEQEKIKNYINSINKDSPIYELSKGKTTVNKPTAKDTNDGICNKYSLEYVKKNDRKKNNDLQFKLTERTEAAPFVLTSTKNVFTKYYSKTITTMMYWTKSDAMDYWNAIKITLKEYFDMLNIEFNKVSED